MELLPIIGIVLFAIALFIVWAEALFYFAGKDNKYGFVPLFGLAVFFPAKEAITTILTKVDLWMVSLAVIIVVFIIFVGSTVYEQAGNKERRWYYLTLLFPVLALVYQFVKR